MNRAPVPDRVCRTVARRRRGFILGFLLLTLTGCLLSPFRLALVVGSSMEPGLRTGDILLVNKRSYRRAEPHRGDIVLAQHRRELIVKRVVGLPGEEVRVSRGRVFVNGALLPESYPIKEGTLLIDSGKLLQGKYALLGDNRDVTPSEAVHAVLPKGAMVGKVIWWLRVRLGE